MNNVYQSGNLSKNTRTLVCDITDCFYIFIPTSRLIHSVCLTIITCLPDVMWNCCVASHDPRISHTYLT